MKLNFKKNLGTTDKVIRTGIGLLLIMFAFKALTGWLKILAIIIAILQFIDVIFSYCIVYDLIGCSTKK